MTHLLDRLQCYSCNDGVDGALIEEALDVLKRLPQDADGNPVVPYFDRIYHPSDHFPGSGDWPRRAMLSEGGRGSARLGIWEAIPLSASEYRRAPVSECYLSQKRATDVAASTR